MSHNDLKALLYFMQQSGYDLLKTSSCWWYDAYHQTSVYFSFPLHRLVRPTLEECDDVFSQRKKVWALRYVSPDDYQGGVESYMWVYRPPYSIEGLSSNNRSKIRRGLRRCEVRKVSFQALAEKGKRARKDTLERHGTSVEEDAFDITLDQCENYEAWGAFVDGHLAAYLITQWVEDWAHLLVNRSSNRYLKNYPNNALIFTAVEELLSRPELSAISYGWEPLEDHASLDHFKAGMGAVQEPVRQSVVLRPFLRAFLKPAICRTLSKLASQFPDNSPMQKISGLLNLAAARRGVRVIK